MRRTVSLLALSLLGSCAQRTETVVIISTDGIRVPQDIDSVNIKVIDKGPTGDDPLYDSASRICLDGQNPTTDNCLNLPITMTLIPGSMRPRDSVRVQVDAQAKNQTVISGASLFTFTEGQSLRLDFVLYGNCLGSVDCSRVDQVCGPDDRCMAISPLSFTGEPDLAVPPDLEIPIDFGRIDLAPPLHVTDMAHDLRGVDLAGCTPQCSGRACGDNGCFGSCGTCSGFTYCESFSGQCLDCGAEGQFCCPSSPACKFSLVCDGTNHCEPPMTGMEPPCGMDSQSCCPGQSCSPGLTCDSSQHCFPTVGLDQPPCGALGEACCAGSCNQGSCISGFCQSPPPDFSMPPPRDMLLHVVDFGISLQDSGTVGLCGGFGQNCCPVPPYTLPCNPPYSCMGASGTKPLASPGTDSGVASLGTCM